MNQNSRTTLLLVNIICIVCQCGSVVAGSFGKVSASFHFQCELNTKVQVNYMQDVSEKDGKSTTKRRKTTLKR